MANEASQGDNHVSVKPPPEPSPLRKAKFFQANMRILVTGGAGFFGSHLVDKQLQQDYMLEAFLARLQASQALTLSNDFKSFIHSAHAHKTTVTTILYTIMDKLLIFKKSKDNS